MQATAATAATAAWQPRFAPRSAAATFRFPRGRETRVQAAPSLPDRQISRVFQRGERARTAAALADGMRARRVPASPGALRAVCMVAWYGIVWIYTRTRADTT